MAIECWSDEQAGFQALERKVETEVPPTLERLAFEGEGLTTEGEGLTRQGEGLTVILQSPSA